MPCAWMTLSQRTASRSIKRRNSSAPPCCALMPWVSKAVFVSGIVSLTLTPMLCARMIKTAKEEHAKRHNIFYRVSERGFNLWHRGYELTLRWSMRHGKTILALGASKTLLDEAGIAATFGSGDDDPGILLVQSEDIVAGAAAFIKAVGKHRHAARDSDPPRI